MPSRNPVGPPTPIPVPIRLDGHRAYARLPPLDLAVAARRGASTTPGPLARTRIPRDQDGRPFLWAGCLPDLSSILAAQGYRAVIDEVVEPWERIELDEAWVAAQPPHVAAFVHAVAANRRCRLGVVGRNRGASWVAQLARAFPAANVAVAVGSAARRASSRRAWDGPCGSRSAS